MPSVLNIPEDQLPALTVLRDLGESGISRLTQEILSKKVILHVGELQRVIAPLLGRDAMLTSQVLAALSLLQRKGRASEQVVDDLTETLRHRSGELDPPWSEDDFERWSTLRAPLAALLQAEPLLTVGKALDLHFAHANILRESQIISDMRPVFDADCNKPLAAVISHTLSLRYLDDGRRKRISLALDHDDLVELVRACERALKKEKALKETFGTLLRTEVVGEAEADSDEAG